MNEKSMTPMDMHLLLTLLEAIKRICTYEKGKLDSYKKSKKSSNKGKKGMKTPWYQVYGQGSQESSFWEELQPVQEAWGRIYHAQHS